MISGKPVCSATSTTLMPWLVKSCAVPPVDSSSMPRSFSSRANSTMPVLSETLSNARRTGVSTLLADAELFELLAQCAAIDPEYGRRPALIALSVAHHRFEQRLFDLAHHQIVQTRRFMPIQRFKVALQGLFGLRAQRHTFAVDLQIATVELRR